jgi:hypothetical protein
MTTTPRRVLDACCGSRMFWFDRQHQDAVYLDKRQESHTLTDRSSAGGARELVISRTWWATSPTCPSMTDRSRSSCSILPTSLATERRDGWPRNTDRSGGNWRDDIRAGFSECFRVLRPDGTFIFKWNEHSITVSEVLSLTPHKPLFGNRCGKTAKSHWIVFMKDRA